MLAEARELYNYTVGNEPFRSQIEEIRDNHTDYVMAKIKTGALFLVLIFSMGKITVHVESPALLSGILILYL